VLSSPQRVPASAFFGNGEAPCSTVSARAGAVRADGGPQGGSDAFAYTRPNEDPMLTSCGRSRNFVIVDNQRL
jgi:hypothetical protein